jgi:hypothetical protein
MRQTALVTHARLGARPVALAARQQRPGRRPAVTVVAHGLHHGGHDDDEDVLPIWSGRLPEVPDPASLPKSRPLGGKTMAEELELIQAAYKQQEAVTKDDLAKYLYSHNWQGDVYVGSNWNILTLIMGLTLFVPLAGLLFAWLSFGTLWTGHYYGI